LGFQTPLSDKTSRHQVKAGDAQALLQPTPIAPEERALVSALPPEDRPEIGPVKPLPPQFSRATIEYRTKEPAGTIIIDTPHTYLYLVLGNGKFTAPTSRRRSGHSYHRDASGSQMKISWTFIAESE
jgi:lipoprotein-anchoring transpeptidase ErfK/SrfK